MSLANRLRHRARKVLVGLCLPIFMALPAPAVLAQEQAERGDDALEIMETFNQQLLEGQEVYELTDEDKQTILFFMGIALLLLLIGTAYLGVSMVVFGKEVFVAHMICAGLTVTLGLAHAVAAVVWFFPF